MSSKLYPTLATVVIALAGAVAMTSAFAVEATQYVPENGSATRSDVKAELKGVQTQYGAIHYGEATVFVDAPATAGKRALAQADDSEASVRVVRLGDATQFVDQPGTRSRADVRAETLAAIRGARHQ
jgi:hypothetical protein